MEKILKLWKFEVQFIYDDLRFEKFIKTFPTYEMQNKRIMIQIVYKHADNIRIDLSVDDERKLDLDPSLIANYRFSEGGDSLYLKAGLLVKRDFERNRMEIINEKDDCCVDLSGFIETFIANILYKIEYLTFHGAALVYQNKGIAFVGKSHSGKSTTVLQLLEQTTGILSNDFFCLDLNGTQIWSLDKTIGVRNMTMPFLKKIIQGWDNEKIIYESEQKYYDLEELEDITYIKSVGLKAILFCSVEQRNTYRLKRIYGAELFRDFMENRIQLSKYVMADYFEIFKKIKDRFAFYKLELPDFSMTDAKEKIFSTNFIEEIVTTL